MTKENLPPNNFMGIKHVNFDDAKIIVLPVPYEGTVTYGKGTQKGPQAIINASKHMEFYDDELDFEPYTHGIHTLPRMAVEDQGSDQMFQSSQKMGNQLAASGKILAVLGGEHSITPGMVSAFAGIHKSMSVLQLDAHADLRDEYNETKYSHACTMHRVLEYCPAVQVGIRSLSLSEQKFIQSEKLPVFFMRNMRKSTDWMDEAIEQLSEYVYITIDLDALDPSIMPSTGTPEPGGMLWDETLAFLKKVSEKRRIVAFDVVELSPQPGSIAPDFLAAKLAYKLIGYIIKSGEKNLTTETQKHEEKEIYNRSRRQNSPPSLTLSPCPLVSMSQNLRAFVVFSNEETSIMNNARDDEKLSYIVQLTDFPDRFRCAMRVNPDDFQSFEELLEVYVRTIHEDRMKPKSIRNLNVIQDCIYAVDDDGELLDLYEGMVIRQDDQKVNLADKPVFQLIRSEDSPDFMLLDLVIDRSQITDKGNSYGYNVRKWLKNQEIFEPFIRGCVIDEYGREADRILDMETIEDQKRFLRAVSKKIWEADFELYSRFIGDKLWFKAPEETLHNIIADRGGTCAEKTSALKLISDAYGFKSEYVLGGPGAKGPFPADALRQILKNMDFDLGKKYMVYWSHMALLYDLEIEDVMIDVANGNVPFLFLTGNEIEKLLGEHRKKGVKVKMVMRDEEFYYHVTPQDIPEYLLEAMQDWIDDVDLIHVFDDGLGLLIREDYYVWPVMYRDEDEKMNEYNWWLELKEKQKFPAVELLDNFSLPGVVANEFKEKYPQKYVDIVDTYDYLVDRYNNSYRESDDDRKYNMAYMFVKLT